MKLAIPTKRLQIDKAQQTILMVVAGAVVVSIFSLVSAKRLLSEASFQRQVVNSKRDAAKQLSQDVAAANQLTSRYATIFANSSESTNVLGGRNTSSSNALPPDGDNPRIVLNALPSVYDFPALISSVSRILSGAGISNPSISGTDQSATTNDAPTFSPQPQPINLSVSGSGSFYNVKKLIRDLERSIRPFDVTNLQLSGSNANMTISLNLTTYYQPAKALTISTETVQ
ncbi:hypothetical protein HY380_02470 [Candidatus Saccharibacteria bacterium]|nr:hypothetical protein [Candidatus Saccharibacteria bacterium]